MRVALSDQSGIQLRESDDRQPEKRFVGLPLCSDNPCEVRGLCITMGGLDGEVCWEDLVCVTIGERYGDARIRQSNLRFMVSLNQGRERNEEVPPRVHLVYPVSPVSPRCAERSTTSRSARH